MASKLQVNSNLAPLLDALWEAKSEVMKMDPEDDEDEIMKEIRRGTFFPEYLEKFDKKLKNLIAMELFEALSQSRTRKDFVRKMCSVMSNGMVEIK